VDIILGTASSYRALDLPNIGNILSISGKTASTVIQYIGRSRESKFNIIYLFPGYKVPVYSSHLEERLQLLLSNYEECKITHINDQNGSIK
jgi:hypothetical protein